MWGASLASEQINHWLSQYGAARFSIDTDKNMAGDLLLPVMDNSSRLFFMQLGLRTNPKRNTTNLGLGYRQHWQNWMYGLNTFYDYDYKGNNARFGVGLEALTDYLKLTTNGYFGLTDWHQSELYIMHDEKPASGFDLRAEAYLPAYPQLGARVKYEKYFGKGIQLATQNAPDRLKDNPHSLTLGLSYTPIPLLTVTGDHKIGDRSETKMGLGVTYRFGVPLRQQLDRDAVNNMRHLGSNKYDFVDRNYDIVMQYSKRRGLNISLPEKIAGKETEIVTISATVNRGEDELAEVMWTPSADFSEDGGKIKKVSKRGLEITLPRIKEQSNSPKKYYINAVAIDNDGNESNKATAEIEVAPLIADRGSAQIADGDFTVITDNQLANGQAQNQLKVVVTDRQGNKVPGVAVAFNAGNGASPATATVTTNDAGEALFNVSSIRAGKAEVTAKVNDQTVQQTVTFVADKGSAQIAEGNFTVITDNQLANGQAQNQLKVVVTDSQGNKVPGAVVTFSADNGASPAPETATSNDAGEVLFSVSNIRAGKTAVTAKVNDQTVQQTVTFVADKGSAQIAEGNFTVITDNQLANGQAQNQLKVVVTDSQGNKVPGAVVTFSADNGASPATATVTTNDAGEALFNVSSIRAGKAEVTAKVNDETVQQTVTFVADKGSAQIAEGNFTVIIDNQIANGQAQNQLKVVVTDGQGNKVPDVTVTFSADNGASPASAMATTNDAGEALFNVTNTRAGKAEVTAKVNDQTVRQTVTFVADKGSAQIADGDFTVITDNQLADGQANNQLKAVVTDRQGNKVSGMAVAFSADNGASPSTETVTTDDAGQALFSVTNTRAGKTTVTAKVNDKAAQQTVTFTAPPSEFFAILADHFRFNVHAGFPKTGIKGAKMTLVFPSADYNPKDYEWKSNQDWIKIDESSGDVTFIDTPARDDAVITATAKNGESTFEYKFKIDRVYEASEVGSWDDVKGYCSDGYPVASDISTEGRGVGKLWNEWAYYSTPYPGCGIWLDHKEGDENYSIIDRSTGSVKNVSPKSQCRAVCLRK